jgi:hypothetical protein
LTWLVTLKKHRHPRPNIYARARSGLCFGHKKLTPAIIAIGLCFAATSASADNVQLDAIKVSELPIHGIETTKSNANIIAIIGGAGLRNKDGKSQNYLVKQGQTFVQAGINFYLLPKSTSIYYQISQNRKKQAMLYATALLVPNVFWLW